MNTRRYVNADLERDVLRAILFHPNAVYAVTSVSTDPSFFADDRWTIIWRAMLRLVEQGKAIDPALIQSVVRSEGYMTDSQIRQALEELLMARESDHHIRDWVDELFAFYQRRELLDVAGRIEAELERGQDGSEVIETMTRRVSVLSGMRVRHSIEQAATELQAEINSAVSAGVFRKGLYMPFPTLNEYTNGIGSNWLTVIGADSGVGKTTMALQMADCVLENTDKRVMFVSLEMTPVELIQRLACSRSLVSHDKISKADLDADDLKAFNDAIEVMKSYGDRLVVITNESFSGPPTAEKIAAVIRVEHMRSPLGMVVLDYFQFFATGRVDEKENDCRTINLACKQLGVPIVMLSQVNRNYIRERRPPEVTDLRGTSQLQNDPDLIIMLDRRSKRIPEERWVVENVIDEEVDAYIGKNRHGRVGQFKLMFDGSRYLFSEASGVLVQASSPPMPSASSFMLMGTP